MAKGFSVIEILVAIAVIGIVLGSLLGMASTAITVATLTRETFQARSLAEEAMEAVRNFRDTVSWNDDDPGDQYDGLGVLTPATSYHPELSLDDPPRWMMILGTETIGAFTRRVNYDDVQRDNTSKNIVSSGGSLDSNTKKVTVEVSWSSGGSTREVELVTYLTNWR